MRKKRTLLASLVALALVVTVVGSAAATPSSDAEFEGADGNLDPEAPINFDWNSFAPVTWPNGGAAPYRVSTNTVSGWEFNGLEDAQDSGADTVFAGGTKQDDNCATVKHGPKPPNKDDLKRIYITHATKEVGGENHVFLGLAWVRIPQNTTNASAHVGFEFNQNEGGCPNTTIPGNDGLSNRSTANGGDMLIVYDFEGSSTDTPTLKLLRWQTTGTCEATGKPATAAGCWVFFQDLTGTGAAEGKVNTSDVGVVDDDLAPPIPPATLSVTEMLGENEFGEAIIDLTAAGVFPAQATSCLSFGRAFGVSRSSGNSAQAAMKDLVGPGDISISNCGQVIIRKVTDPAGDTETEFGYMTDVATLPATTTSPFSLKDGESNTINNVAAPGSYFVTEDDPSGDTYALTDIDCDDSTVPSANIDIDVANRTVDFDIEPDEVLDCTFTNTLQTGAIEVTKTRKYASATEGDPNDQPHPGVTFEVYDGTTLVASGATDADGVVCFDGLAFGTYTVKEVVPSGYLSDAANDEQSVTVNNTAACDDDPYGGETASFHNTPLTDVDIDVAAQDPGATKSTINCVDELDESIGSSGAAEDPASLSVDDLEPGTYVCTIFIDP